MLIVAGGAEERHSNTAAKLIGPWNNTVDMTIDVATKYTGAASFILGASAQGSTATSMTSNGWWSYAALHPAWGNGTHRALFSLGTATQIGWAKGSGNDESEIRLVTSTGTYDSVAEFSKNEWHRTKVEFDSGVWTVWASDNGAAWAEVLSRDDSGSYTTLNLTMGVVFTSDEGKEVNTDYHVDDVHFWDSTGDNWNSRITTMSDFPRISEAHMPDTAGAKTESDAGQAAKLDEIPPDDVDNATIDETDYWTDVEDFKPAGETIQAVMITQVDDCPHSVPSANHLYYNVREGGVLSANSEEGIVQRGRSVDDNWLTYAGYYPWTPGEVNWTEAVFEACQYGCSLVSGETDQITVQAIYFGSAHEWEPPAVAGIPHEIYQVEQAINRSNTY